MKKFMASFQIEVFAKSEAEARKIVRKRLGKTAGGDFMLVEVPARTERCDICQLTYIPSEVSDVNGERLCAYCRFDKCG